MNFLHVASGASRGRKIGAGSSVARSAAQQRSFQKVDINERIKQQLASDRVLLYMKGSPDFPQCGFSARAVAALKACGTKFTHVNILEDPELREGLKRYSNWPTYPQLYVAGELVGGADIVEQMYRSGELQELIGTP